MMMIWPSSLMTSSCRAYKQSSYTHINIWTMYYDCLIGTSKMPHDLFRSYFCSSQSFLLFYLCFCFSFNFFFFTFFSFSLYIWFLFFLFSLTIPFIIFLMRTSGFFIPWIDFVSAFVRGVVAVFAYYQNGRCHRLLSALTFPLGIRQFFRFSIIK